MTVASAKFIWLATTKLFDGLTFIHERGDHGVFAVHGYPFGPDASTFIVETDEESWRRAGLDAFDVTQPPGPSDMASKAYLEALFAEHLDGHPLLVNNSRWGNFRTIRCGRWRQGNVVILGDAAHTAHFSVGSGTKMAMEDAAALVQCLTAHARRPRRRPRGVRDGPPPAGRQDPGRGRAEPVVVGALRPLPRPPRRPPVRLPLLLPGHSRSTSWPPATPAS